MNFNPMNDLWFVVLGSLLSFWPCSSGHLLSRANMKESFIVREDSDAIAYIMMALAIPFSIDALLDAYKYFCGKKSNEEEEIFLTFTERLLLSVGFLVSPAYTIYAVSHDSSSSNNNVDLNVLMLQKFSVLLLVGTTWESLTRLYPAYFPRIILFFGFGSLVVGLLTALIQDVCDLHYYSTYVVNLSLAFKVMGALIFLCLMFHWMVRFSVKTWRTTVPSSSETYGGFSSIFFPMSYVITCFVSILITICLDNVAIHSDKHYGFVVFEVCLLVLHLQKGKHAEEKQMETSNTARKSYLRKFYLILNNSLLSNLCITMTSLFLLYVT